MGQIGFVEIGVLIVALTVFWSAVMGLVYRFTARYTIGEPVRWFSGFASALLGLPLLFGITGFTIDFAVRAGFEQGTLPLIGAALLGLVIGFFASSIPNAFFMRKMGGGKLSYGEACRVQLVLLALTIVLAVMSRA